MSGEFTRGVWIVAYREVLRMVRDPARMASSFVMPLMFLVIFGSGFGRLIGGMAPGVNFIKFLFPGIIGMTVFMTSMMSGVSVVWDREFGFLKELLVAPISRLGIVVGKVIGTVVLALFQASVMLLLAPFIGVSITLTLLAKLIPLLVIVSLSLSSFGILLAVRMRSQQGFQMIIQLLIFPMMFLSGVFFPLNNVPGWLSTISKFNPLTYGVDSVRHAFLDAVGAGAPHLLGVTLFGHVMTMVQDALVMAGVGVVLLTLSAAAFARQP